MADDDTKAKDDALAIPDELQQQFPELIALIKESESMNNEERQYWINILPIMTPEQVENLRDILENERSQLAAIDKKYAKEIDQIDNAEVVRKMEEERKKRRIERQKQQRTEKKQESKRAEKLLEEIENL